MRTSIKSVLAAALLGAATMSGTAAQAASGDVIFNGAVVSTCLLSVGTAGTLAASADNKTLDSELGGGVAGKAVIVTSGANFQISASAPTSWAVKPGTFSDATTFSTKLQTTGATTLPLADGTTGRDLTVGQTNVDVHLKAVTPTVFHSGAYQGVVTVTCEATGS